MADKPVEHMAIHTEAIEDHYDIGAKLGSGHFSVVKEGTLKKTGEKFAVKIIDKRKLGNQKDRLMKEVEILEALDHSNIIKLLDIYETPRRYVGARAEAQRQFSAGANDPRLVDRAVHPPPPLTTAARLRTGFTSSWSW